MAAAREIQHEWRRFRHDPPGMRFRNHRHRMKRKPRWLTIVRLVIGVALVAAGVVFLFLPGPGLVGIFFGVALLAGMSTGLARLLDRAEPWARARVDGARAWWRRRSRGAQGAVIALAAVVAAAGGFVVWTEWLGPRVAG